ncbi:hypothetical protein C4J97_2404 [Pseudomonas orientalis]|nr:hypothetical protein C4J97_2404 [Pseudomonas orientalis]
MCERRLKGRHYRWQAGRREQRPCTVPASFMLLRVFNN